MFPVFDEDENVLQELEETIPVPWMYKFDWETRQIKKGLDGRYLRTETYEEYLAEVAKKILNTKRFRYAIYTDRMGVDFMDNIGLLPKSVQLLLIKNEAEEALEAHDEIDRATVQVLEFEKKGIYFSVDIYGVRENTKVVTDVWSR